MTKQSPLELWEHAQYVLCLGNVPLGCFELSLVTGMCGPCAWWQVAAYQLGQLLPPEQRPLPMALIRIADSSTNVVPNGGAHLSPAPACCMLTLDDPVQGDWRFQACEVAQTVILPCAQAPAGAAQRASPQPQR